MGALSAEDAGDLNRQPGQIGTDFHEFKAAATEIFAGF